ncbi:anthranilate synthase component I [Falsibacillus pallidus]|uniref:Anthranilate synthase component 1 n=1 Tax=Falsibacillus pallidus TaxID=493781 RepID=A0A370GHM0_9BACI|nr:anthranilate synthase component I [Falsibacillus pallidus]RDI43147.1 anthranilate synthase component I [Falsibacillus pallidus]
MRTTEEKVEQRCKVIKMEGDSLTPISIFHRVKGRKKCLLESSLKHLETGRYSFIAFNPVREVKAFGEQVKLVDHLKGTKLEKSGQALRVLEEFLPSTDVSGEYPFSAGAIGYIGYDVIRQHEFIGSEKANQLGMPDLHFMVYQDVIVFDHISQEVHIICTTLSRNRTGEELEKDAIEIKNMIETDLRPNEPVGKAMEFKKEISQAEFENMVKEAKEYIKNGDVFQVVLSQRLQADFTGSPFDLYRKLRKTNPSPYMFYLDFDDYVVIGSSPESFIKLNGRILTTNPIAGTRRRGKTQEEDLFFEKELLNDEKELAEHKMLVDLGRNDIGRVCEVGSITIPKFMAIERYKYVMHIVSEATGILNDDLTGIDALISCLPAGTVSGAPKIRAMQIINELEKNKRGVYSGAIGYINGNGNMDFALAIRTMVIKDHKAYVQAGAGVVHDSIPKLEYQETLNKAKALLEVSK